MAWRASPSKVLQKPWVHTPAVRWHSWQNLSMDLRRWLLLGPVKDDLDLLLHPESKGSWQQRDDKRGNKR